MTHFDDCPKVQYKGKYNICTCDMAGEEIAIISLRIKQLEGQLSWWNLLAKITLLFFPAPF